MSIDALKAYRYSIKNDLKYIKNFLKEFVRRFNILFREEYKNTMMDTDNMAVFEIEVKSLYDDICEEHPEFVDIINNTRLFTEGEVVYEISWDKDTNSVTVDIVDELYGYFKDLKAKQLSLEEEIKELESR